MVLFFIILVLLIAGFAYLCYRRRKGKEKREPNLGLVDKHFLLAQFYFECWR